MPYAVIEHGAKQYKVQEGDEILIEEAQGEPGADIQFDRVLLYSDGTAVQVGTPQLAGATVAGTVKGEAKGPKLIAFKFRRRKANSKTKIGHRQKLLNVTITKISAS